MTEVVFLFGAGASVDADVPDTYKFVTNFEEHIKQHHPELFEQLLSILKVIGKFNERNSVTEQKKVDVEQLLYNLRRLIEREADPLLDFYEEKKCTVVIDQGNLVLLKNLLENFIREQVIIEDESKLEYLKELLKFDKPIEIFSTNYDTCIEQLSHINHMRYTDGFDIYWNPENFERKFDVKHFKMHGSIIWYEDMKTKECVKIPVHAFFEGKPVDLKLIYGEDVKPLMIYPAQKAEYIEPLTDLQLMFKNRLINEKTKFLIVVGYSFRDEYVIHMLWDAARVNEDLHVILISPNAQQLFENKLKYINRAKGDLSRIHDRVICLPYPFSTVIYQLKNYYLIKLAQIVNAFQNALEAERTGGEISWDYSVKLCIEAEFSTKTEDILQRGNKKWEDLRLGPNPDLLLYGFKALLHSVICKDGFEDTWLKRANQTLSLFNVESLDISDTKGGLTFFRIGQNGYQSNLEKFLADWISPLIAERRKKVELLTPKFKNALDRINCSLDKLEAFDGYLRKLVKGVNSIPEYKALESDSPEVKSFIVRIENAKQRRAWDGNLREPSSIILGVERGRLRSFLGAESFQLDLNRKSSAKP